MNSSLWWGPESRVTIASHVFEGPPIDVDELKLCRSCYLEALRMAREEAAISLACGSLVAKRKVELLDEEIARVKDKGTHARGSSR